jgi:hypothetical protein
VGFRVGDVAENKTNIPLISLAHGLSKTPGLSEVDEFEEEVAFGIVDFFE